MCVSPAIVWRPIQAVPLTVGTVSSRPCDPVVDKQAQKGTEVSFDLSVLYPKYLQQQKPSGKQSIVGTSGGTKEPRFPKPKHWLIGHTTSPAGLLAIGRKIGSHQSDTQMLPAGNYFLLAQTDSQFMPIHDVKFSNRPASFQRKHRSHSKM